jgi:hypothetical protein
MPIQRFYVPTSSPYKLYTQKFTSSTTWTAPVGVTNVKYTIVGGGGGGGSSSYTQTSTSTYSIFHPGGGAGAEVSRGYTDVNPGTPYLVEVGAGGIGSIANANSSAVVLAGQGGTSTFALNYVLKNAVINGAREFSNNFWRAGSSTNTSPNYPTNLTSAFNNTSLGVFASNVSTQTSTSFSITNVTVNGITPFLQAVASGNHNELVQIVPVDPSTQYTLSAYAVRQLSGTQQMTSGIAISWLTSASATTFISTNTSTTTLLSSSSVTQFTVTATSPSNATHAVLRFARWCSSANSEYALFTGMQLEQGNVANNYTGPLVPGDHVDSPFGLIEVSSGSFAFGGGGGGSMWNTTEFLGVGPGGGRPGRTSGSGFIPSAVGGHGSGAGLIPFPGIIIRSISAISSTSGWSVSYTDLNNGRANIPNSIPRTSSAHTSNTYFSMNINEGTEEGYAASGYGGHVASSGPIITKGYVSPGSNKNSLPTSYGSGGDAVGFATISSTNILENGFDGKPGIVIIEYFGPAA